MVIKGFQFLFSLRLMTCLSCLAGLIALTPSQSVWAVKSQEVVATVSAVDSKTKASSSDLDGETVQTSSHSAEFKSMGAASGSELGSKVFNLKEAVKFALDNNPSLKQYRETLNQSDANIGILRALLFPALSYDFKAGSAQSATATGNTVLFGGSSYNTYYGDLSLSQPLYTYGALAAVRAGHIVTDLNRVNIQLQERILTQQVVQAFYSVILNKRLLTFLEETKPVVEKSVETSQSRYKIGRSQLLDVLQAKTQLALLQPQIEQARNNFEASGVQLATLLGLTNVSTVTVRGKLETFLFKDIKPLIVEKDLYLPEVEQNKLQINQVLENRDVEMGKYWPTLKLVGNYITNAYTQSDIFNSANQSWNAYLELNIPIFQGLASKYDAANYTSQQIQLEHARKQLDNTIYNNQVTSKAALDSSEVSLVSAVLADNLAQSSLAEAVRQYKLATIDFLQFLTIEQSALQAKSSVEQLRYNSVVAYTNYFVSLGQPLNKWIDFLNSGVKR